MKIAPLKNSSLLAAAAAGLSLGMYLPRASAADFTFFQSGNWYTPGDVNWTPNPKGAADIDNGFFNTAGNNAIVNAAATYNAGGDFLLGAGNTMLIDGSGASWTQNLGTNNWAKVGASGGSSVVSTVTIRNGGTMNMASNGQQLRVGLDGGAGNITVESTGGGLNTAIGTATNSLQIGTGSSVSLLGGTNKLAGINSAGTLTFGGGTTTTTQIDGAGTIAFNGGNNTTGNLNGASSVSFVNGTNTTNSTGFISSAAISFSGGTNVTGDLTGAGTRTISGGTNTLKQFTGAGVFNVTGGTTAATNFDMGTAGASLTVSAGALNFSGNLTNTRTVSITGGAVTVGNTLNTSTSSNISISGGGSLTKSGAGNVNLSSTATFVLNGSGSFVMSGTGEFQPGAQTGTTQSISGNATLKIAGLLAFQALPTGVTTLKFDINGGALTLGGNNGVDGIYAASVGEYLNFTTGSTGSILFTNAANAQNNIFEGQIRYNDIAYDATNYMTAFSVTHPNGTDTLITPVPEPATVAAGLLALGSLAFSQRRRLRRFLTARRLPMAA